MRLEPIGHGGQLRRQRSRLFGRRCRAHRQPDEAAEFLRHGTGLRRPTFQAGIAIERW